MFDLGGGTFDVTLLTIEGNVYLLGEGHCWRLPPWRY